MSDQSETKNKATLGQVLKVGLDAQVREILAAASIWVDEIGSIELGLYPDGDDVDEVYHLNLRIRNRDDSQGGSIMLAFESDLLEELATKLNDCLDRR
jgi:hypothetical protein